MSPGNAQESMVSIAKLLAPDEPDVVRGVRAATDGDPWSALIRALSARGLAAVFDWEEDPGEIRSLLEALPSYPDNLSWSWYGAYESDGFDVTTSQPASAHPVFARMETKTSWPVGGTRRYTDDGERARSYRPGLSWAGWPVGVGDGGGAVVSRW
ncbi:DUF6630 family protein [Nocardia sp. bgisy134]|uniref:DUF6630 family protein n=1 Tax=unclassified Nocardia TaxID=2637762 RepID=UPI003D755971